MLNLDATFKCVHGIVHMQELDRLKMTLNSVVLGFEITPMPS